MTPMTLEQAISSVQVRNEMRGKSGEYPNGEGWGHCWREDGYWIPKDAWKVIDAHLAKGAQVPDQPDKALLISMSCRHRHDFGLLDRRAQESIIHSMHQLWEEVVGRGFYDETKRESYLSMLSQRGEVEGG